MSKEKKQKTADVKTEKSQLCLDFDSKKINNDSNLSAGKVVSISSIVDKQKSSLVKDIVRNTKSF